MGSQVESIIHECRGKPDDINLKILRYWLEGKGGSVTWETLVETLEDIGLRALAKDIRDVKLQGEEGGREGQMEGRRRSECGGYGYERSADLTTVVVGWWELEQDAVTTVIPLEGDSTYTQLSCTCHLTFPSLCVPPVVPSAPPETTLPVLLVTHHLILSHPPQHLVWAWAVLVHVSCMIPVPSILFVPA